MGEVKHCQEELDKGFLGFINSIKRVNEPRTH